MTVKILRLEGEKYVPYREAEDYQTAMKVLNNYSVDGLYKIERRGKATYCRINNSRSLESLSDGFLKSLL